MATNEILQFAETDTGTNLLTQAEYLDDAQRPIGNQPGVARSKLVNKALRQASLIAAGLAEYIADNQANNITDALTPQNIADYLQAALTGALGVTPPQFDNSTKLATTAFVQRALGNMQGANVISAATTLSAADVGRAYSLDSGASITLPLFSDVQPGSMFLFVNADTTAKTISSQGADTIYAVSAGAFDGTLTGVTLQPGEWAIICANPSQWEVFAGSNLMGHLSGQFGASLASNGYQKLPSGLIVQWGSTSSATTTTTVTELTVTLPIAFPNNIFPVAVTRTTDVSASASPFTADCVSATALTHFTISHARSAGSVANSWRWIAIGY